MPQIIRSVRHSDIVATLGPNSFTAYRGLRRVAHRDCGPSCSCRTAANHTAAKLTAKLQNTARKAVKTTGSLQRMSDSLDRLNGALVHTRETADLRGRVRP